MATPYMSEVDKHAQSILILLRDAQSKHEEEKKLLESQKQEFQVEMAVERERLKGEREQHEYKIRYDREALQQEQKQLEQAKQRGPEIIHAQEPVTVEVGGEKFRTELRTLSKCEGSVFPALVDTLQRKRKDKDKNERDPYIFIDRDGRHFRFILNFMRQGKQVMRSSAMRNPDSYVLEEILAEVQYYQMAELERLVKLKKTSLEKAVNIEAFVKAGFFKPVSNHPAVKYVTTKETVIKNQNLTNILFEKVCFHHAVKFEACVMTGARFSRCSLRSVLNFTDVDFHRALFENCEGVDISTAFCFNNTQYSPKDNFNPPLA